MVRRQAGSGPPSPFRFGNLHCRCAFSAAVLTLSLMLSAYPVRAQSGDASLGDPPVKTVATAKPEPGVLSGTPLPQPAPDSENGGASEDGPPVEGVDDDAGPPPPAVLPGLPPSLPDAPAEQTPADDSAGLRPTSPHNADRNVLDVDDLPAGVESPEITEKRAMDDEVARMLEQRRHRVPHGYTGPYESPIDPLTRPESGLPAERDKLTRVLFDRRDEPAVRRAPGRFDHLKPLESDLPVVVNVQVEAWIDFFSGRGKSYFKNYLEKSSRYLPTIKAVFKEQGIPLDLAYIALIESGFSPGVRSWAGATGMFQFMRYTAPSYGMRLDQFVDERYDWRRSARASARMLKDLYADLKDWNLAICAYNAGAGRMHQVINRYGTADFWTLSRYAFLARESRLYVPKLYAALIMAKKPELYGFNDLRYEPEAPPLETVPMKDAYALEDVADCLGTGVDELVLLNLELRRRVTPPDSPGWMLKVPRGLAAKFAESEKCANLKRAKTRTRVVVHTVKAGDTPAKIAGMYGVKVTDLERANGRLKGGLKPGRKLTIPESGVVVAKGGPTDKARPATRTVSTDGLKAGTYVVRPGDNPWTIAQKYKIAPDDVLAWNNLREGQIIMPGTKLIIYAGEKAKVEPPPGPLASAREEWGRPTKLPMDRRSYVVTDGDTLEAISKRFKTTVDQIMKWNGMKGDAIKPGQALRVKK